LTCKSVSSGEEVLAVVHDSADDEIIKERLEGTATLESRFDPAETWRKIK
jgi:hypothetical protein